MSTYKVIRNVDGEIEEVSLEYTDCDRRDLTVTITSHGRSLSLATLKLYHEELKGMQAIPPTDQPLAAHHFNRFTFGKSIQIQAFK